MLVEPTIESTVNLSWIQAQAYLKKAYALEFSLENLLERTPFRPCSVSLSKVDIIFAYNGFNIGERLIIIEREPSSISEFITATLHPSECQMVIVYRDMRRGWQNKLTINFLNKYLPSIG
jgi:hypothetical protein